MPMQSRTDGAFDPETVLVLTSVFEDAWRSLNGSANIGPGGDVQRGKLARHIILLAQAGERDPAKLRDDALAFVRQLRSD